MQIKAKCPSCKFEFEIKGQDKLDKCPICHFSIQSESIQNSKKILKDEIDLDIDYSFGYRVLKD